MNKNGMFYTNVDDYETKEDIMNDFIALRMYDMAKDKEIDRLNNIIDKQDRDITTLTKDKIKLKNIINELEKLLKQELNTIRNDEFFCNLTNEDYIEFILDKLKELKEGNK